MSNPTDNKDVANASSGRVIAVIYMILSLLLIPLGFVFVAGMTISKAKRLHSASDPYERMYWLLNVFACVVLGYGFILLGLVTADSLLGDTWKLAERWPSLWQCLNGTKTVHIGVLMDVITALLVAFCAICATRCFGRLDENEVWHAPGWVRSRRSRNSRQRDHRVERRKGGRGVRM